MGASKVVLSELSEYRLSAARTCGIETINPAKQDLLEGILAQFGPDKADYVFECVGINATMGQAIEYARKGSTIVVVGVFGDMGSINMGLVQDHELNLIGSAMYREEDSRKAIEIVGAGLVKFDPLITHRVKFTDYAAAYKLIDEQKDKAMKVMVDMD